MAEPLDYLPFALAARPGTVDGIECGRLVAAGLTLLQRSVPLVRALAGRRAAILLPTSAPFITALAAAEGRGAVLIPPLTAPSEVAHQLGDADVGAVFTTTALADRVPGALVRVLLDDAPRAARVVAAGMTADIDLGSHFGLDLEGDPDAPGATDECVIVFGNSRRGRAPGAILTHRNLMANARGAARAAGQSADDHVLALLPWTRLFGLTATAVTPLLAGAHVTTMARFHPGRALDLLGAGAITQVVGVPAVFAGLLAALDRRGGRLESGLRLAACGGAVLDMGVQDRWFDATGVELRQGYGLTEAGPVCLFNDVARRNARGSLGTPVPGVEVAIDAPAGEPGEVLVRSASVFAGYIPDGATGLTRTTDGWLRTGDLGQATTDGRVEFRGVAGPY